MQDETMIDKKILVVGESFRPHQQLLMEHLVDLGYELVFCDGVKGYSGIEINKVWMDEVLVKIVPEAVKPKAWYRRGRWE